MRYKVVIRHKLLKRLRLLPFNIKDKFLYLVKDLENTGPVLTHWRNYSRLGPDTYHCHLGYSWVACWRCEKQSIEIEVYYVGSRESAPY